MVSQEMVEKHVSDKLDAILGHRPASAPSVLMDAGSSNLPTAESHSQSQDDPEEDGNIHVTVLQVHLMNSLTF